MKALQPIGEAKERFLNIIQADPETSVKWEKESMFAAQQIAKTDFAIQCAASNPKSLYNAMVNVASIGLSLNPATAYAYLVPRDGAICLDISYRGLIKVATDTGSIMWAKADVVYSSDSFEYNGPASVPTHRADPFSEDRGDVVGVYCIAKTADGDYLIETMSKKELDEIKDKSKSTKGPGAKYSPWITFYTEMCKKSVIKRASKTWPKTERHEKLDNLIEYVNQEEGIDFDEAPKTEDIKLFDDLIHNKNGAALYNLFREDFEYWGRVEATFYEPRKKGKFAAMVKGLMTDATDYVKSVIEGIQENIDNPHFVLEAFNEMNPDEIRIFEEMISPELRVAIDNIIDEAA